MNTASISGLLLIIISLGLLPFVKSWWSYAAEIILIVLFVVTVLAPKGRVQGEAPAGTAWQLPEPAFTFPYVEHVYMWFRKKVMPFKVIFSFGSWVITVIPEIDARGNTPRQFSVDTTSGATYIRPYSETTQEDEIHILANNSPELLKLDGFCYRSNVSKICQGEWFIRNVALDRQQSGGSFSMVIEKNGQYLYGILHVGDAVNVHYATILIEPDAGG